MSNLYINTLPDPSTNCTITSLNASSISVLSLLSSSTLNVSGFSTLQNVTTTNLNTTNATISELLVTGSSMLSETTMTYLQLITDTGIKSTDTIFYFIPSIIISASVSNQTTQTTMFTFSVPAADTAYSMEGYIDVSARTSGTANIFVTFTSPGSGTQITKGINGSVLSASSIGINAVGTYSTFTEMIYAKASTTILMGVSGTFVMTYSAKVCLRQPNF